MGESDVSVENTQYWGDYCPGREDQCSSVDTFIVACIMHDTVLLARIRDRQSFNGRKKEFV